MKKSSIFILSLIIVSWGCGAERTNGGGDGEDGQEVEEGFDMNADLDDLGDSDLTDLPDGCLPEELCGNGIDDDCDGEIDEGFDLMTDLENCGACNFPCEPANAVAECVDGTCGIAECLEGSYDINGDPFDGCEYGCTWEADEEVPGDGGTCLDGLDNDCDGRVDDQDPDCEECVPEFCNGLDDDCDTLVDNGFDLRTDILNCGTCGTVCDHRPNSVPICVMGECDIQCLPEFTDLDGNILNGCEAICTPTPDPSEYACDGIDNDCDGVKDEDYVPSTCGFGACETNSVCDSGEEVCVPLPPESPTDALCDGIDNDCDESVDEDFQPVTCVGACVGGATCEGGTEICGPQDEEIDATCDGVDGDCDGEVDEDYLPYVCGTGVCENESTCSGGSETCNPRPPRSTEDLTCDALDDDCDGLVDEEYVPYECGVGYCRNSSICDNGSEGCTPADPLSPSDLICDGVDEDCSGDADEDYAPYSCGLGACVAQSTCVAGFEDCTPGTPSMSDRNCDNVDEDCDGFTDEDYDPYTCGLGLCVTSSTCVAGVENCTPMTPPVSLDLNCDNQDEDCDGSVDEDYQPYTCGLGDCMRSSQCIGGVQSCTAGPQTGSDAACDGHDNDCDGATDEHYVPYTCGTGPCAAQSTCIAGVERCTPGSGTPEVCNGVDDDCNGVPDDIFPCMTGQTRGCTTSCGSAGTQTCDASCAWGACTPPTETCNGSDDDCDGTCDEPGCCRGGSGSCTTSCGSTGSRTCSTSCAWGTCNPPVETCNGADDDCDGTCDEPGCCRGSSRACTTSCTTTGTQNCNTGCGWDACIPPDEICNGIDDDCDAVCDEPGCCRNSTGPCTTSCGSAGTRQCSSTCLWGACTPPSEVCNGADDDCDGSCDEGWACCANQSGSCTTSCGSTGTRVCSASCQWGTCTPPAETCNGVDDDCDGTCDEPGCCRNSSGSCTTSCGSTGTRVCSASCAWGTCTPPTETCNGVDDDCDGSTDEGFGDGYEPNNTCTAARDLGTINDTPASTNQIAVSASLLNNGDEDWFRISAADLDPTNYDTFNLEVFWESNPGGLAIDIYKGDCANRICTGVVDCFNWYTNYRAAGTPPTGENPCSNSASTTYNLCNFADGATYFIRVWRASGSGYCSAYQFRIRNGYAIPAAGCNHL